MKRGLKHNAFTLIELMAAMAVSCVVLLGASALLGRALDHYSQTTSRIETSESARIGWSQIRADLESARFLQGAVFENPGADRPQGRLGIFRLIKDASQRETQRIADLGAVHYYLADQTMNGRVVRCLMRGTRESADTFDALESDEMESLFARREQMDEPVVTGVSSFEVKPKRWSRGWVDWNADDSFSPEAVELRVVIVKPGIAAQMKTPADWDGSGRFQEILGGIRDAASNPHLEVFSGLFPFGANEE
ncbi:MAG: prepilin-type N-terminal cleavage/methylation domain-containing protein [Luteolibacter sp.]